MRKGIIISCLLSILILSCASNHAEVKYPVYVTNTSVVDLLPPADNVQEIDALFLVSIKTGKDTFSTLSYFTSDKSGMYISLINDFGVDMGSITYTGESLDMTTGVLPSALKAQYIVADLQFALYDDKAVNDALKKEGLSFVCEKGCRIILKGKKEIEKITFDEDGGIKINNLLRGYEWTLIKNKE